MKAATDKHKVVSEAEWLKARKKLLVKEKKFLRLQEELGEERRSLPWVKVTKDYVFEGPKGKQTLAGLFEGRSQLVNKEIERSSRFLAQGRLFPDSTDDGQRSARGHAPRLSLARIRAIAWCAP